MAPRTKRYREITVKELEKRLSVLEAGGGSYKQTLTNNSSNDLSGFDFNKPIHFLVQWVYSDQGTGFVDTAVTISQGFADEFKDTFRLYDGDATLVFDGDIVQHVFTMDLSTYDSAEVVNVLADIDLGGQSPTSVKAFQY